MTSEENFTRFAVIGAGVIGKRIANAIAATKGASLLVITRGSSTTTNENYKTASVSDYGDVAAVTAVLKEYSIQAVISTVSQEALLIQLRLADAAKAAGVQIFVPSEFGFVGTGITTGFLGQKNQVIQHLVSLGLPYIRFFTGGFIEWTPWLLGIEDANPKKAYIVQGSGDVPASFNTADDIAGFVAYLLTAYPPSQIQKRNVIRLQTVRATLRELAASLNATDVEFVKEMPGEHSARKTDLHGHIKSGRASVVWDLPKEQQETEIHNSLWHGHRWQNVEETHGSKTV